MSKKVDTPVFEDLLTAQDLTGVVNNAATINKNHTNSKEKNAPKNYGKNSKTSTVMDKSSCGSSKKKKK